MAIHTSRVHHISFKRAGPEFAESGHVGLDHYMPLIFDAERVVTGDFADFVGAHTVLSRSGAQSGKFCWGYGDYGAGAGFSEEGVFGGGVFGEGDGCA